MAKKEKKEPKMTKNGKQRKDLPQGLDRITLFADKTIESLTKLRDRVQKWSEKTRDNVARDRLTTMAHLFTEASKSIETASTKASSLKDSDWTPPKAGAYTKMDDFSVGQRVVIKDEYEDVYSALDKRMLDNMKILSEIKQGKRTSYLVTGAGYIPKSHLDAFVE